MSFCRVHTLLWHITYAWEYQDGTLIDLQLASAIFVLIQSFYLATPLSRSSRHFFGTPLRRSLVFGPLHIKAHTKSCASDMGHPPWQRWVVEKTRSQTTKVCKKRISADCKAVGILRSFTSKSLNHQAVVILCSNILYDNNKIQHDVTSTHATSHLQ